MIRAIPIIAALFFAAESAAETEVEAAQKAADRLKQASQMLSDAKGAANRVKALTETVRAYEDGLEAVREGLRKAAIKEQALARRLAASEAEIGQLLGVLQSMGRNKAPALLLHPSGAVGTARSGMILSDVTPALEARASELRAQLQEVTVLRSLQESAAATLREGFVSAQDARTTLSQAISNRTDLPRRFVENPQKTAALLEATDTLEAFASGLSGIAIGEVSGSLPDISSRKGQLLLPVEGTILRVSGEADAAGITRPGLVVATRPQALVTTPSPATLRYRGPLLDYGTVVILEPQAGLLIVLAGLNVAYGEPGQVVPEGSPVGLMGNSSDSSNDGLLIDNSDPAGALRSETLYIEVRENNKPVDPATWFLTNEG